MLQHSYSNYSTATDKVNNDKLVIMAAAASSGSAAGAAALPPVAAGTVVDKKDAHDLVVSVREFLTDRFKHFDDTVFDGIAVQFQANSSAIDTATAILADGTKSRQSKGDSLASLVVRQFGARVLKRTPAKIGSNKINTVGVSNNKE